MKANIIKFLVIILIFLNLSCITPVDEKQYREAIKDVKSEDIDFAFMKFNSYLRKYPDATHSQEVKFAIAEYYFQIKDYRDAIYKLTEYIKDYSEDKDIIFAKVLLYKSLLEYKNEPLLTEKIKQEFFSKSIFLIFSDSKTKYYNSILDNTYKIVDYLDKIEVFKNDDLILKITP